MKHLIITAVMLAMGMLTANAATDMDNSKTTDNSVIVDMKTTEGDIRIKLYNDTPLHRDNFVKLVNEGFYDGVLFHRVINQFMIQTGDPDSKNAAPGAMLGSGGPNYQIDAEFVYPKYFHKRGALAAARTGDAMNPEKKSSSCQFYIVTGRKFSPTELDAMEGRMQQQQLQDIFNRLAMQHRDSIMALQQAGNHEALEALRQELIAQTEAQAAKEGPAKFTPEQREAYTTVGGAPHLDGAYTVFGEVISGMDTVDRIEKAETDSNDRPKQDIRVLSMKVVDPK